MWYYGGECVLCETYGTVYHKEWILVYKEFFFNDNVVKTEDRRQMVKNKYNWIKMYEIFLLKVVRKKTVGKHLEGIRLRQKEC